MKKKIGISFTKTNFQFYWNWFTPRDLGDEFELVELSFKRNNVEDFAVCDGFVLAGGVDIDPHIYGQNRDYAYGPESFQPERDLFEEKIYRYAQTNQLPVLGICRGLQLVNVLHGGNLIRDLGPANEIHRKTESDKEHRVHTVPDTLLREIVQQPEGMVNSAHHQAIDPEALGENLMVNAYSGPDNSVVEGIEFEDKTGLPFMLCVQWHPERMLDREENEYSGNIKKRFLEEIKKSIAQKHAHHQSGN